MKFNYLFVAALLSLSPPLAAKVKFSEWRLDVDFTVTHPVMSAQLVESEQPQLVVFGLNEQGKRMLAIYKMTMDAEGSGIEKFIRISNQEISPELLAYDLLKTENGQKLVFQSNSALHEFDPTSNQFKQLLAIESIYLQPQAQFLSSRNFAKDVNGDELDDIVVPGFKGVSLLLQQVDGSFTRQDLPIPPKMELNSDSATYSETDLHFADLNLDQKTDLAVVTDGGLTVFHQNGKGIFDYEPHNLQLPVDVHALDWWEIREADGESPDQSNLSHRTVNRIEDINNDQVPDLLVRFSRSEGVLDRQNKYEVYLGQSAQGKLSYMEQPNNVLGQEGTTIGIETIDLNGDDRSEILMASLDIGLSQIIGALLSGSIDQDVFIYRMDEEDNFGDKPLVNKEVDLSFSLSSGRSGEPVVEVADFDGDGLKDLMFSSGEKTLRFYQGTAGKKPFKSRSVKHKVTLPKDGNHVDAKDLNNDGKHDIIIRYGRQDDEKLGNRLIILLSS